MRAPLAGRARHVSRWAGLSASGVVLSYGMRSPIRHPPCQQPSACFPAALYCCLCTLLATRVEARKHRNLYLIICLLDCRSQARPHERYADYQSHEGIRLSEPNKKQGRTKRVGLDKMYIHVSSFIYINILFPISDLRSSN